MKRVFGAAFLLFTLAAMTACGSETEARLDAASERETADEGPDSAAKALYEAWKADDRDSAASFGSPAAIDELWKEAWEPPGYEFTSCDFSHEDVGFTSPPPPDFETIYKSRCEFANDTRGVLEMASEGDSSGWRVISVKRTPTDVGPN